MAQKKTHPGKTPKAPREEKSIFPMMVTTWLVMLSTSAAIALYAYQEINALKQQSKAQNAALEGKIDYLEDKITELEIEPRHLRQTDEVTSSIEHYSTHTDETISTIDAMTGPINSEGFIEESAKPLLTNDNFTNSSPYVMTAEPSTTLNEEESTIEPTVNTEITTEPEIEESVTSTEKIPHQSSSTHELRTRRVLVLAVELKDLITTDANYTLILKNLLPLLDDQQARNYVNNLLSYAQQPYHSYTTLTDEFNALINDIILAYRQQKEDRSLAEALSLQFSKLVQIRKIDAQNTSADTLETQIARIERHLHQRELETALTLVEELGEPATSMLKHWHQKASVYHTRQQTFERFYDYISSTAFLPSPVEGE